ncbi:TspO/MBR family protein [Romboutsia sp. 1001713B170131_170501_G6]|uniref:TspO/MBR family protein n=1 Tax=Romboutsia sp. 1001713B170131_170501_G6 TaxID=2787108 RepID=UPI0018AA81C0|nr:TspO/MBR family protein [Romboutsia sp. 1001713B170131_170501_G6]
MIISVKEVINFFISVLIPLVVGYASSMISQIIAGTNTAANYASLIKPNFAPPSFIFPIVWTILYILMGISAYLILKKGYESTKVKDAMFYYWLQLGLNFLWSILFFGFDLRLTALIVLVIILLIVIVMAYKFFKINKKATYINIPYILWLMYALYLNYFIWVINK